MHIINSTRIGDMTMDVAYWFVHKSQSSLFVFKFCFIIYKLFISIFGMRILPIITIKDYSEIKKNIGRRVVKTNRKGLSICSSSPFDDEPPIFQKDLSDLFETHFHDVLISGGSDVIIDDAYKWIISDFCVNKSNNIFCSDSLLFREKNNWGLLRNNISESPQVIESGILISGKYPNNYYHCLFENLNRCMLIDDAIIPKDVPVLVDKVITSIPSLEKLVSFLIQGSQRAIIPIEAGVMYHCNNLYYIDHLNFIIPHHRKLSVSPDERSYYDSNLLRFQRNILLNHRERSSLPTRIFITRVNSASRHYNEEEVFGVLKVFGFKKVAPEVLTFEEQIQLFYNAEYIIGGTGAAFSNILFCQPKCKILCFRPVHSKDGTPLFKTIAKINGCDFWHYKPDKIYKDSVHSNYYISPSKLKSTLTRLWGMNN